MYLFWQSVILGITNLSNWHILLGMAGVSFVSSLYSIVAGLSLKGAKSGPRVATGFLLVLATPAVECLAVSGFILLCLPAITLGRGFISSASMWLLIWPVIKSGFWAMLFVFVLCCFPVVGRTISDTPGVPVFLQGAMILKSVTQTTYALANDGKKLPDYVFPSLWHNLGYLAVGLAVFWIAAICVAMFINEVKKGQKFREAMLDQLALLLARIVGPAFGIVPLLMYGRFWQLYIQAHQ